MQRGRFLDRGCRITAKAIEEGNDQFGCIGQVPRSRVANDDRCFIQCLQPFMSTQEELAQPLRRCDSLVSGTLHNVTEHLSRVRIPTHQRQVRLDGT